jgi:hypothetical protein
VLFRGCDLPQDCQARVRTGFTEFATPKVVIECRCVLLATSRVPGPSCAPMSFDRSDNRITAIHWRPGRRRAAFSPADNKKTPIPKSRLYTSEHSTFQDSVRRVTDPTLFGRPIIVSNNQYRFLVAEQLAAIGTEADILLESVRRDSGPAIVAGATFAAKRDENTLLVALAADHVISDPTAFVKVCRLAADAAGADR